MYKYSNTSIANLYTCHPDLIILFETVIKYVDVTIICGHRGQEEQNKAFENNKSTLKYPDSKHNRLPSSATDAVSYPIQWDDLEQHYYLSGYIKGIADMLYEQGKMSRRIRCGADWNRNMLVTDETFLDLFHFELI